MQKYRKAPDSVVLQRVFMGFPGRSTRIGFAAIGFLFSLARLRQALRAPRIISKKDLEASLWRVLEWFTIIDVVA